MYLFFAFRFIRSDREMFYILRAASNGFYDAFRTHHILVLPSPGWHKFYFRNGSLKKKTHTEALLKKNK